MEKTRSDGFPARDGITYEQPDGYESITPPKIDIPPAPKPPVHPLDEAYGVGDDDDGPGETPPLVRDSGRD